MLHLSADDPGGMLVPSTMTAHGLRTPPSNNWHLSKTLPLTFWWKLRAEVQAYRRTHWRPLWIPRPDVKIRRSGTTLTFVKAVQHLTRLPHWSATWQCRIPRLTEQPQTSRPTQLYLYPTFDNGGHGKQPRSMTTLASGSGSTSGTGSGQFNTHYKNDLLLLLYITLW